PDMDNDLNEQESIVVAFTGSNDPLALLNAARDLKKHLIGLPLVSKVKLLGNPGEQITIEYDDEQALAMGVDPKQMAQLLGARNNIIQGGSIQLAGKQVTLRPESDFAALQPLQNTAIPLANGSAIPLSQIAKVRFSPSEPATQFMRFGGERAVGLGIVPRDGINLIHFGQSVAHEIELAKTRYDALQLHTLIFQPARVEARLSDLSRSLLMGILVVAGVLLMFMGLRLGIVVASVIPLVALTSLAIFALGGGLLQQMSISALVIALGMLVDNAIVMAENIQWRLDNGATRANAAKGAVKELAIPLASATGTTLAAFIPMLMARSTTADFTRDLPIVIMLTLTVSYLFAVFVTPAFSRFTLKKRTLPVATRASLPEKLSRISLSRPITVVGSALVLVVLSFLGMGWVKQQFFPSSDRNEVVIEIKMPEGTHLNITDEASFELESALLNHERVVDVAGYVGRSGPHFYYNINQIPWSPHFAQIVVHTQTTHDVPELLTFIRQFAQEHLPLADVVPRALEQGPPVQSPIEVRLYESDQALLYQQSEKVLQVLKKIPGTVNVRHDLSMGAPSIRFAINDAAAGTMGLTRADIASSLYGKTRGLQVGQYRAGEDPVPVVLRSSKGERLNPDDLETIQVSSDRGGHAPLGQVSQPIWEWLPGAIKHRNRTRIATISSELLPGVAASQVQQELEAQLAQIDWEPTTRLEYGGQGEGSSQANAGMALALPVGLILLFAILLAEFNSFRRVGIVLVTVPLAAAGVVPGLLVSNSPFGFMSMLGVIALIGIVVNNAIVLIDMIVSRMGEGESLESAIAEAVQRRTRPILLTTTTTIAGLLPLALSDSTLWPPMAWAIISGLLASTLLTLLVVPSLYLLLFRPRHFQLPPALGKVVATGLLLGLGGWSLKAQEPPVYSLQEAMAQVQHRPQAQAAGAQAEAAQQDALTAKRAGLLPIVATQVTASWLDESAEISTPLGPFQLGEDQAQRWDVQVSQPLWDPTNRYGAVPASRAQAEAARFQALSTLQDLRQEAGLRWLAVADLQAQIDTLLEQQKSLNERLNETQARVDAGRSIEADALKIKLALAHLEGQLLALRENKNTAEWALGQALGLAGPAKIRADEFPIPSISQPAQPRLELASLDAQIQSIQAVAKQVKMERLPDLRAVAAYSYADGDPFSDGSHWQARLEMRWVPFASGTRKTRI
ncbi:MAG: efflux RND transporter permease subunit, partial [Acidobacteria bacterium]|nr:efflux RND transporter permease subunit [Acidobacteriota bacterium]